MLGCDLTCKRYGPFAPVMSYHQNWQTVLVLVHYGYIDRDYFDLLGNEKWFTMSLSKKSQQVIIRTKPALNTDQDHKSAIDQFNNVQCVINQCQAEIGSTNYKVIWSILAKRPATLYMLHTKLRADGSKCALSKVHAQVIRYIVNNH